MTYEEIAARWEAGMIRRLLDAGISPSAIFGRPEPDEDAAVVERKIRALEEEAVRSERELGEKMRELGLDPDALRTQLAGEPSQTVAPVPEDPQEAIRAMEADQARIETELERKLRELGLDPEQLRIQNPPEELPAIVPGPEDTGEVLRRMQEEVGRSESEFLQKLRELGLDPEELRKLPTDR